MAIDERSINLPGQWAKDAQTNVPVPPVPGVAYRNPGVDEALMAAGAAYKSYVDSSNWNQLQYLTTGLLGLAQKYGMLPYSSQTDYPVDGRCAGLNGLWYRAVQPSGPNNGGAQPLSNASYWIVADMLPTCTTEGSGAAYTITSSLLPSSIPEGFRFRVRFHTSNTSTPPTLNINGSGAFPVRVEASSAPAMTLNRILGDAVFDVERAGNIYVLIGAIRNASSTVPGIVRVPSGNGLGLSGDALTMGLGSTLVAGALRVTAGNGLGVSSGVISMALGDTASAGAIQATNGNGLNISNGVLSMALGSTADVGALQMLDSHTSTSKAQPPTADALRRAFDDRFASNSSSTGGYINLPGGFILQYWTMNLVAMQTATISQYWDFSIPFADISYATNLTPRQFVTPNLRITDKTTTRLTFEIQIQNGVVGGLDCIAIGKR